MKEKHVNRPSFMSHQTDLLQIYEPIKVSVTIDAKDSEFYSAEILELYFSNKKRSGGENIRHVEYNHERSQAFLTFAETNGTLQPFSK